MKKLYLLSSVIIVLLASCSKRDLGSGNIDVNEFMRTRDRGTVAYVDYFTGNYIVDAYAGYSVVESWGGVAPREYDDQYAYFSSRGLQTIYNYSGNYFSSGRIVDSWLTWSEAIYLLDDLSHPQ